MRVTQSLRGRDGRKPHEGEQAVDGARAQAAAPVERGHEARIAQRLDAEAPGAGAGLVEERAEKRAELPVEVRHARNVAVATALGAGPGADAFFLAFPAAVLLRGVFGGRGVGAAFIPMFARLLSGAGPAGRLAVVSPQKRTHSAWIYPVRSQ